MSQYPDTDFEEKGWWVAAPWIVFMVAPMISVWADDDFSTADRVVVVSLSVAFAALYLFGFRHTNFVRSPAMATRYLLGLVVLAAAIAYVGHWAAIGVLPFIATFGNFTLPLPWAIGIDVLAVAGSFAAPLVAGVFDDLWFLGVIVMATAVGTLLVRFLSDSSEHQRVHHLQLAATDERLRVARDVHDVLGHSLTVVVLKAELGSRLLDGVEATPGTAESLDRARHELDELQTVSRQALADIRATVGGLRVADLDDELAAATAVLRDAGVDVEIAGNSGVVPPPHRSLFAWVVREAATNVVRHANASRVWIGIGPDRLTVSDDGCGRHDTSVGNGLRGLGERVAARAGTLDVRDRSGGGTVVEATL